MPYNEKGELTIQGSKGWFCLLCTCSWMLFWGIIGAALMEYTDLPKWVGGVILILGQGTFGLVPGMFFWHEAKVLTGVKGEHLRDDVGTTSEVETKENERT